MKRWIWLILLLPMIASALVLGYYFNLRPRETGGETQRIVDQAGREVEVRLTINRVVSLWPEATRIIYSLHAQNRLVGVDNMMGDDPVVSKAYPQIKEIPGLGSVSKRTVSFEQLAALNPDLVFTSTDFPDFADKIEEELGIPTLCVRYHAPNATTELEGMIEAVEMLGRVLGKEEEAEELSTFIGAEFSKVTNLTSNIPDSEKPRVYVAFAYDLLKTSGYLETMDFAGGINVAQGTEKPWYSVSLEQLIKWNPEIIVVHGLSKASPQDVMAKEGWQAIKAVKKGRIYKVYLGYVGLDPASTIVQTMQMAKLFHPEQFQELDLREEANLVYKRFYGSKIYDDLAEEMGLSEP